MIRKIGLASLVCLSFIGTAKAEPTNELECLAYNIYHEARDQSTAGQLAVALVTRNRVKDSRFPNTFCEVVKQGPSRPSWKNKNVMIPLRHRCQFSWFCDGKSDKIRNEDAYKKALMIAFYILNKDSFDITDGATHYHAYYVTPEWAKTKKRLAKIEDHIFYKWE